LVLYKPPLCNNNTGIIRGWRGIIAL